MSTSSLTTIIPPRNPLFVISTPLFVISTKRSAWRDLIALYDTIKTSQHYSVAICSPCRNNSDKNLAKFMD